VGVEKLPSAGMVLAWLFSGCVRSFFFPTG